MRVRILALLRERPRNTNQVSTMLGIDYKTAEHHLRVLRENGLVVPHGDGYGALFHPTGELESAWPEVEEIARRAGLASQGEK